MYNTKVSCYQTHSGGYLIVLFEAAGLDFQFSQLINLDLSQPK